MNATTDDFWDRIHQLQHLPMLGETTFEEYLDYLGTVGPVAAELAEAKAVLDVGPGLGNFLRGLPPHVTSRHGIEASVENRIKLLTEDGIASWAPGDLSAVKSQDSILKCDLATCISVFQHCNAAMVLTLLKDVHSALREGGAFYANGIVNEATRTLSDDENKAGGSHSHDLGEMSRLAQAAGLTVTGTHSYDHPAIHIGVWVARMVK